MAGKLQFTLQEFQEAATRSASRRATLATSKKFEPNSAISTLLGMGATKGDGQMQTPTAKHVLALIAKSLSENLNNAIWSGKRNPSGDTTEDLFDGFDTITQQDIAAGRIAASNGNYIKLTDEITSVNAVDVAKHILWSLDPRLRSQDLIMYCSQDFVDKYRSTSACGDACNKQERGLPSFSRRYRLQPPLRSADGGGL